jgi:hypothetical protein
VCVCVCVREREREREIACVLRNDVLKGCVMVMRYDVKGLNG